MRRRTLDERSTAQFYKKKFRWLTNCLYCGNPATELDHVFPISIAAQLELRRPSVFAAVRRGLVVVPCCGECNRICANRPFLSPLEKRAFLKRQLAKKYGKMARAVVWDEDEIDDLGPNLKSTINQKMQEKARIELRLSWPLGRTAVSRETAVRLLIKRHLTTRDRAVDAVSGRLRP